MGTETPTQPKQNPDWAKRSFWATFITSVLIILLIAWGQYQQWKTNEETRRAREEQRTRGKPLTVGMVKFAGFLPLYLAKEKGYFGEIKVDLKEVLTPEEKTAELASGELDAVCETIDMFLYRRDMKDYPRDLQEKIVWALDWSNGADGIVADPQKVDSIKGLKGHTVAVEHGMPPHLVLLLALEREGLDPGNDVKIREWPYHEVWKAFANGEFDVVGTWEPHLSLVRKMRPGKVITSSADFPQLVLDVLLIREDVLQARKGDLRALYEGWCRAVRDCQENLDVVVKNFPYTKFDVTRESDLFDMLSAYDGKPAPILWIDIDENRILFAGTTNQKSIKAIFESISQVMSNHRLIRQTYQARDFIDDSILSR